MVRLTEISQNHNYQFWAFQIMGWTGWVVLFAIRDIYWNQPFERSALLVIDAIAGLLLTTVLRYVYRAVWDEPVWRRVLTVIVGSYLMAAIWQPIKNYSQFVYYDEFDAVTEYGLMAYFNGMIGYSYFLIISWSGLYFGFKFYNLLQVEKQRSIRAESMAHEAQLRMLRYQLNPHFLFNTLNAISTLILERSNDAANQMVSKLSNFLRYSLDNDPMQKVSLEHEINTMKLYLEIEKVRFDERLRVEFEIEDEALKAMVPSLLLQPLVENSIKYAVATSEQGGEIKIAAGVSGDKLLLNVSDDGPGISGEDEDIQSVSGVGIANTSNRLREIYGNQQSLKFGRAEPHGLRIEIMIPFEVV